MTSDATFKRRVNVVFHGLGLSCIGGAIFLQILAFSSILYQGYFKAVEKNPTILSSEIILTAFALIYFIYIYQLLIRQSNKHFLT
jgi:hypothetical protein